MSEEEKRNSIDFSCFGVKRALCNYNRLNAVKEAPNERQREKKRQNNWNKSNNKHDNRRFMLIFIHLFCCCTESKEEKKNNIDLIKFNTSFSIVSTCFYCLAAKCFCCYDKHLNELVFYVIPRDSSTTCAYRSFSLSPFLSHHFIYPSKAIEMYKQDDWNSDCNQLSLCPPPP